MTTLELVAFDEFDGIRGTARLRRGVIARARAPLFGHGRGADMWSATLGLRLSCVVNLAGGAVRAQIPRQFQHFATDATGFF
jgi:hypothetical protein